MTDSQEQILKELLIKYFEGGNASSNTGSLLKSFLEVIRDFVKENFE